MEDEPYEEAEEERSFPPPNDERVRREIAFGEWLSPVRPVAYWILIGVCVAVWGIMELAGGSTRSDVLLRFGADSGRLVGRGEWWRMLSSGFIHIGLLHLAMNMWCVYALGGLLERYYGPWKLMGLFTFAVLGGSIGTMLVRPDVLAAGASGGIFGWFGAIGVMYLKYRGKFSPAWGQRVATWLGQVIFANLIIALFVPNIGHEAHLGGLLFGAAFAALVPSRPGFLDAPRAWTAPLALLALVNIPALALAGQNAWSLRDDPWNYPMASYRDENFEIQYPVVFAPAQEKETSDEVKIKNVNFILPDLFVVVGVLAASEQAALKEARDTLIAKFKDHTVRMSKVEPLRIRGEAWTRYVGARDEAPVEFYVHEPSQWHVIGYYPGRESETFRPTLRKMAESFVKR